MRKNNNPKKSGKSDSLPTTIKQVAEMAGVSTATVSRVISGRAGVRDELVKKVARVVKQLDYQPNRVARNLRVRTTKLIGLIIPDIQNPFFTSVVRGIEDVLQGSGFTLLLGNTDDNQQRESLYLDTLRAEGAAGIIFVPADVKSEALKRLLQTRMPMVAIDRVPAGLNMDQVVVANTDGARAATEQLIKKGHRRIGLINGPLELNTARERQIGYEQALQAAAYQVSPELIINTNFRQSGGYDAMNRLLSLPEPPTAIFSTNNVMTLGALQAIHERGLLIPSGMGLISFDDMPWATSIQPPLTTVSQPIYELGSSAAELLLARMRQPERPIRRIVLQTQLIVRSSCG